MGGTGNYRGFSGNMVGPNSPGRFDNPFFIQARRIISPIKFAVFVGKSACRDLAIAAKISLWEI